MGKDMKLTEVEIRVLGALSEKKLTTPAYYPLSLNGLRAACNQKSNREPVMALSEEEIKNALQDLKLKKLALFSSGTSQRVTKYKHLLQETFDLNVKETAILTLLFLRGEQTLGEIRNRTHRMYAFQSLEEVEEILENLNQREIPLATILPKKPGQKEQRYMHLLSEFERVVPEDSTFEKTEFEILQDTVEELKNEVENLKNQIEEMKKNII